MRRSILAALILTAAALTFGTTHAVTHAHAAPSQQPQPMVGVSLSAPSIAGAGYTKVITVNAYNSTDVTVTLDYSFWTGGNALWQASPSAVYADQDGSIISIISPTMCVRLSNGCYTTWHLTLAPWQYASLTIDVIAGQVGAYDRYFHSWTTWSIFPDFTSEDDRSLKVVYHED